MTPSVPPAAAVSRLPATSPRDGAGGEGRSPTCPYPLEALLRSIPFLHGIDRVDSARLIGTVEDMELQAGVIIVAEGTAGDHALYLLEHGRVEVSIATPTGERSFAQVEAPSYFGEMAMLLARRTATVRALTDVRLWRVPAATLEQLLRDRPALALAAARWGLETLERSRRELVGAPVATPAERPPLAVSAPTHRRPLAWRFAGAGLAVGIPLALSLLPPPSGLAPAGWYVSLVVLGAAIAWLFEPVPDFVVALLMAAIWGAAGLVPLPLALAGFASSSWLVSLGAFALAVAMARSGLLFRVALLLLRTFPATGAGQLLALLVGGLVLTPLVPLALARVAVVAPLARELANELGYPPRSRGSAGIAVAGLVGYGLFSSVFLTGMVMNFFVLDLLPPPTRAHFDWLAWLLAAAPAGIVIFLGAAVMLLILFRAPAPPRATAAMLRRQEQVLGPVSPRERVLLAAVAVLVGGVLLQPLLAIDPAWLAVGALALTLAGGGLDRATYRSAIDWGFLTFFGVLLGTGGVLHSVGVDTWIGMRLVPIAQSVGDPAMLVLLLGIFVILCRIVLPWIPATLVLSLALVPAAGQVGIAPWVVGFVVLLLANTWLHPNQSDFHRLLRDATGAELLTERDGLFAGIGITVITLVAVIASIPYWRALGLLGP